MRPVGGSGGRLDINASFLQRFMPYATPTGWSFTLQAEATYDWERRDASVPVTARVGKIVRLAPLPVQIDASSRDYAARFDNGPKDWGARATVTFLLPAGG